MDTPVRQGASACLHGPMLLLRLDILILHLLLPLLLTSTSSGLIVTIGLQGQSERSNGSLVQLGPSSVGLWCQSQPTWDVCKWYRPGFSQPEPNPDSCTCYCQDPSPLSPCTCSCPSTSLSPWQISRSTSGTCLLSLSTLDARDSGWWRCSLTPRNSGGTNATFGEVMLRREGMQAPEIVLNPAEVNLVEGEEQILSCSVERLVSAGQPSTGWTVGGDSRPGENELVERLPGEGVPVWRLNTSLTYRANAGDTALACTVTARDDQNVQVVFSKEGRITVVPSNLLRAGLQTWELVLVILLPLLVILLLLLLLLCYCLGWCCFSQRRLKDPPSPVQSSSSLQHVMPPSSGRSRRKVRPAPYVDTPLPSHTDSAASPPPKSLQPQLNLPWDPYADQNDSPLHFREEGGFSSAGSISSIASSGQDEEIDLGSNFKALGPRFSVLARLYAGADDHEGKIREAADKEASRGKPDGLTAKERLHGELIEELNRRSLAEPKAEWRVGPPPSTPSPRPSSSPSMRIGLPSTPSTRLSSSPLATLTPAGQKGFEAGSPHHGSTKTLGECSQPPNAESKFRISSDYSPREGTFRERERRRLSLVLEQVEHQIEHQHQHQIEHPVPDETWV